MNEQEGHIKEFLASSTYSQLSANQQKHAQDILNRFTQHMMDEQHLADTAWTPQAVKEVMVGDFIADPALTNQFGIAVAPVLKAYLSYLDVANQAELVAAIDEQRTNMNHCRKAHQTWAQLHGDQQPAAKETKPAEQKSTTEAAPAVKPLTKQQLADFQKQCGHAVAVEPEFQNQELDAAGQQYVVAQFIKLMAQECNEYPGSWEFHDLQRVLGMMMPLDPDITAKQIKNIVPTAQALFDYLKRTKQINLEQYRTALKAIAKMQPSQDMLSSLSRRERETQLMLSFIRSNGIDTDDVKTAEKWMDEHRQEVASFMRTLLNPWSDYERQQMATKRRNQARQTSAGAVKRRVPRGIKFSKKSRRKKHHKK
ncbi:hypothetical protein [Limosilactobacillus sp.]|uniref:hypothetical protein n=1 Tax=Limosilactobacillus sp. TaxID=2773925 RepID=UPI003F0C6435